MPARAAADPSRWRLAIDTGGTFTDCIALDPAGDTHRLKVLTSGVLRLPVVEVIDARQLRIESPWPLARDALAGLTAESDRLTIIASDPAGGLTFDGEVDVSPGALLTVDTQRPAPIVAAHLLTGTPFTEPLPPLDLRLATTRGTNALLTRAVTPTALFITRGFGDLLRIGNQQRPDIFALNIQRPAPLYEAVVEVDERLDARGEVLRPIDLDQLRADAQHLRDRGITTAAICFMHSFRAPAHEHAAANVLRDCGFAHIICSADIAPVMRIVPRAQTTVVDACLTPILRDYFDDVQRHAAAPLTISTSAGGLVDVDAFSPKDGLLSGPAGGVAGAAAIARELDIDRFVTFDMGGTSTDVARFDGDYDFDFEHTVGDATVAAPAIAIHTVAAGGGSICGYRQNALHVGPDSAGAAPGPACYGLGGPLTITDVNLLLDRIDPAQFTIPIDRAAAARAAETLRTSLPEPPALDDLLRGFLDIANETMADAIRTISTHRGDDPTDCALIAFGGAGPQHACAIAERLGMSTIIIPADASILSATGVQQAALERIATRQVLQTLDDLGDDWAMILRDLEADARRQLTEAGIDTAIIRRRLINVRLLGQDTPLTIDIEAEATLADLAAAFRAAYTRTYGHAAPDRPIEIESIRIFAASEPPTGSPREADITGDSIPGPAIIPARDTAIALDRGWTATRRAGAVILQRHDEPDRAGAPAASSIARDELFAHRFMTIAETMGAALQRTALSTNVKERLDFSCTVLDTRGTLIANAPHMPVHLGAMGLCVREVMAALEINPGDVIITNDPHYGGSHLPDITVITPVWLDGSHLGFVASRAHHADVGSPQPGSMPPDAMTLTQEGIRIAPQHLIRAGAPQFDTIEALLGSGPHPARAIADNLADLRAQVAANHHGATMLTDLARAHSADTVADHMQRITRRAADLTRQALATLGERTFTATEPLDDGAALTVRITTSDDHATIDFTGSAPVHPGNLNATPAIVRSVVLYILRLLTSEPIPLNEGMLDPIDLIIPRGTMLNPDFSRDAAQCPAVVGGNVETSQRLVDLLMKALGLGAASQGTMNNTLFGNNDFAYYETVCGGAGAGELFAGASAVHTHMTNTAITDPEVLEHRYPVRLERFAVRTGSGGAGAHFGGDGVVREITALARLDLSILSQRRASAPFGANGGEAGARGEQQIIRRDGEVVTLPGIAATTLHPGDRFILKTPGGGGWGDQTELATLSRQHCFQPLGIPDLFGDHSVQLLSIIQVCPLERRVVLEGKA